MKRDARIGLAVVLVVGLTITLLVARSIHQNGAQAGIDQDPQPKRETASATETQPVDTGATIDSAYDAQAKAVMEFQTQHDYRPTAITETSANTPAGVYVDVGPGPGATTPNGMSRPQSQAGGITPPAVNAANVLPPLGQPPIGVAPVPPQPTTVN